MNNSPKKKDAYLSLRLPDALRDGLDRLSVTEDRPVSSLVRLAITEYLETRKALER